MAKVEPLWGIMGGATTTLIDTPSDQPMTPMLTPTRLRMEPLEDRTVPVILPNGFSESLVTTGLTLPTSLAVAPDGQLFVTEKAGDVRIVRDGQLQATPFLSVTTDDDGERGLLGFEFDPNYRDNGFVYAYYTVPGTGSAAPFNRVSRFTADGNTVAPGSEVVLVNLDPLSAANNHNGGAIHFGPDGKLYIAVGDNNDGANSQTVANRLGKILRINPDGTIPNDNPTDFPGISGSPSGANRAIWAVGLRNPFTFAFDPVSGRMYINDVGGTLFEEVNPGQAGANYGWPVTEGNFDPAQFPNFTNPVYAYGRDGDGPRFGASIAGSAFYRAGDGGFPADFNGDYLFSDFIGGWINALDRDTAAFSNLADDLTGTRVVDVDVGLNGEVFYLDLAGPPGEGSIYRITFNGPGTSPLAVGNAAGSTAQLVNPTTGAVALTVDAFGPGFTGGVRVAAADVTGDRVQDLVVGAGPGGGPRVRIFDGATGQPVRDFFAFESTFTGGVFVAAGDLDGDGMADVAVSPDIGGGPRVIVLSGRDGSVLADFFGIDDPNFRGGARVAMGDVNGDGVTDIVVAAGTGGGPRVAVWDGRSFAQGTNGGSPTRLFNDFFAFEPSLRDGAYVAAADFDGDGLSEVITGGGPGGAPRVVVFAGDLLPADPNAAIVASFFAGDPAARDGVTVAARDVDGDGPVELLTGAGPDNPPTVTAFRVAAGSGTPVATIDVLDPTATGGVFVG